MDNSQEFDINFRANLTGEEALLKEISKNIIEPVQRATASASVDFNLGSRNFAVRPKASTKAYEIASKAKSSNIVSPLSVADSAASHIDKKAIRSVRTATRIFLDDSADATWDSKSERRIIESLDVRGLDQTLANLEAGLIDAVEGIDKFGRAIQRNSRVAREMPSALRGPASLVSTLTSLISGDSKYVEARSAEHLNEMFGKNKGRGLSFNTLIGQHGADAMLTAFGAGKRLISGIELKSKGKEDKLFKTAQDSVKLQSNSANINELTTYGKYNTLGVTVFDPKDISKLAGAFIANPSIMRRYMLESLNSTKDSTLSSNFVGKIKFDKTPEDYTSTNAEGKKVYQAKKYESDRAEYEKNTISKGTTAYRRSLTNVLGKSGQSLDASVVPALLAQIETASEEEKAALLRMAQAIFKEMKSKQPDSSSKERKALEKLGLLDVESIDSLDENAVKALGFGFKTAERSVKLADLGSDMLKEFNLGSMDQVKKQYIAFTNAITDNVKELDSGLGKQLSNIFNSLGDSITDPKEVYKAIQSVLSDEEGNQKNVPKHVRARLEALQAMLAQANESVMNLYTEDISSQVARINPGASGQKLRSAIASEKERRLNVTGGDLGAVGTIITTGLWADQLGRFEETEDEASDKRPKRPSVRRGIREAAARARTAVNVLNQEIIDQQESIVENFEDLQQDAMTASRLSEEPVSEIPEIMPVAKRLSDNAERATDAANNLIDVVHEDLKTKSEDLSRVASHLENASAAGVSLRRPTGTARGQEADKRRGAMKTMPTRGEAPPFADEEKSEVIFKASERSGLGDEDLPDWLYRMSDETESEQLGSVIKSLRTMATSLLDVISMLAISLNNSALDMVNLFKAIVAQLTRIAADLKGIQMNADGAVSAAQSALDSSQETAEAVKEAVEPVRQAVEPVQQAVTGDLDEQLKKPYRALMKQFHPDVYRGPRQQDIASHINELKDAGDLAGLQELQNAGDDLIKVINQQRVAMGKLALETTEVAREVNQASEIIDATPYVPKPDYELGPEHRRTQFNQRNITPGLMQHYGNLREAWNPANVAPELRGQFEEKYQAIGKKFTTGRFDDLMRMTVDVPAKIIQEHRKAAESIADATSTALVPVKQELSSISEEVSTALVPLGKSAIAVREEVSSALVPLEKAGLAIRNEVSEALVPLEESGLVVRKEVIEAVEPLEQAGVALRNKVRSIDAPDEDYIEGQFREIDTSPRAALPAGQPPAGGQPPKPPTPPAAQPAGPQGGPPVGPLQKYLNIIEKIQQAIQEWKQKLQGLGNFLNQFAGQIGQLRQTLNQAFSQAKQYVSQFAQFAQQGLSRLGDVVDNLGNKFAGFGKKVRNGFESAKESAATLYFLSSTMTQAGSKLSSFGNQQIQKANQFLTEYSGYEMATNRLSVSAGVGRNEDGTVNPERGFNIAQDFVFGMQRGDFQTAGGNAIYTDMYNAEEIAQAAYYYQSAAGTGPSGQSLLSSKSGQEAMAQILGPILNMAAATQTNPEEYIKGVVNIAQQFGYDPASQEDAGVMGNIANVVGQIANVTTLEIPDILETFKYVGPQLNMLAGGGPGAGLGDALMLVEMASRAGIKGSMAGTGIGQIVSTFVDVPEAVAESVAPLLGLGNVQNGEAVAAFENMFQTEDGKIEGGILGAISKIVESTSGEPQEVAKVLSKIFTQNATRTSSAIAAQIVKASESQEFLDAAAAYNAGDYDKANKLYEEAMAKTSDTVTASVSRLKNAFFQLKVTMFDAVKNPLKEYLNELANILFTLGDALKENPFISKLAVGLTSVISVVATVLGALLTMGGTLFMIQRSFIMAGGSISLFFGILSTVAAGFFAMIPVILIVGIAIAALAGHLQKSGKSFGDFASEIRSKFNEGLGKTIQDFSLKALKAIELVTFGFYEFVNTILMGNDVGSNFLGALLGKVFGPQAAGIILGMLNKVSSNLTSFRTGVGEDVDGIVSKFEALKNIPSVFKGLGQAFAQGYVDINDAVAINDLGKAFGIDGLQVIVVEAANQIWLAISEIWAIFNYFKAEFVAVFDSLREETGTSIDTGPFLSFLVLIRSIVVAIVAGFMGALLGATMAVAGLTRRLNGMSEGNSRIQELVKNVTGLTITLEKLGTILGFVFGASIAGRMLMMIQPVGQLAVHFAKIGIVAGQVGVAIGKTIAMFALQAAQFAVNLLLLGLQAAAWAAYIGIQIFAAGVGLASAAVSAILALAKTQETGAVTASGLAAVFASAQFLILKAVILGIAAIVLIFVAIWFLAIAALIIAAIGILAIIAATDGLRAALDAAIGFVMAFVDGIRNVIDLMSGVYDWAMGFLMASSGASDLAGVLKEIGTALAYLVGLPVAVLFGVIVAVAGVVIKLSKGIASFVNNMRASSGAMSTFSAAGSAIIAVFKMVWDIIKFLGKAVVEFAIGFITPFLVIGKFLLPSIQNMFKSLGQVANAISRILKVISPLLGLLKLVGAAFGYIAAGAVLYFFGALIKKAMIVMTVIGNLADNVAKVFEWLAMAIKALVNGDIMEMFKLLLNALGQILVGVADVILDVVAGFFQALIDAIVMLLQGLDWLARKAGIDWFGEAATSVEGLSNDLENLKNLASGFVEDKLTFTVSPEYDINLSEEERRRAMGVLTEIEEFKVRIPVETYIDSDGAGLIDTIIELQNRTLQISYDEFTQSDFGQGTYDIVVRYVDANGKVIENLGSEIPGLTGKDGKPLEVFYKTDNAATKDVNEAGYFALINGQYTYIDLMPNGSGGLSYIVDRAAGELGDGDVFVTEADRIRKRINDRRAASESESLGDTGGQAFGGIFADATSWVSKIIGESDSMQSLFGFAGIDVADLRDGDLGTALTPQQIQAMIDAADQSPRAKKILGPYLDSALENSDEYSDAYWELENLKEQLKAGLISEEEYLRAAEKLYKIMNANKVTTEDLAAETKHLMEIEEARMNLAKAMSEDFAKAVSSTFLTYENYILGSVARINAAILTANEVVMGNKDKIDEALAEGGSDFYYRDPYTGALNSRAYTTEEMMMSFGGFNEWDPNVDGPLDNWLLTSTDSSAVAWRESMTYQGKDLNTTAAAMVGDNRWGANVGMRDMIIGDMATTLSPDDLSDLNKSFLDYRDIAGYAATQTGDWNLGDYLTDSGQMFMQDGVWTDIDSTNLEDAIAWMNDTYGITLSVDTITDDTFQDVKNLIFGSDGKIVGATSELLQSLPQIVEGPLGKFAVMSKEVFEGLSNEQKAYLQAAGVTVVQVTEEQMARYALSLGEQLPQLIKESVGTDPTIDIKFEDVTNDGMAEAYFVDPATGAKTYVSGWTGQMGRGVLGAAGLNAASTADDYTIDSKDEWEAAYAAMGGAEGTGYADLEAFQTAMGPFLNEFLATQAEIKAAADQAAAATTAAVTQGVVDADIALAVETGTYNALGRFFKGDGDTGVTDAVSPDPPPPASGTKGGRQIGGAVDGSDGAAIGGDSGGTGAGGALGGGSGETGGDTAAGGEGAGAGAGGGFGGDQYGGDEDAPVVKPPYDEAFAASVIDSFGAGAISAFVGLDSLVTDYMGLNFGGQNPAGESVDAVNPRNVPLVTDWKQYNEEIERRKRAELAARLREEYQSTSLEEFDKPATTIQPDAVAPGPVVPTESAPEPEETIPPVDATPIPDPTPRLLPGEADKPADPEDGDIAARRDQLLKDLALFEQLGRGSYQAYTLLPDVARDLRERELAYQNRLMELIANGGILDNWFAQGDVSQGLVAQYDGPGDPIYQIMNSWLKEQSTLYRSGDDQRGDDLAAISGAGKYSPWKDENQGIAYDTSDPNSIFGLILQGVDSASTGVVDNAISPQDIYDSIDIASMMAEQGLSADDARRQAYDVIAALEATGFITKEQADYLEGDVDTQFTDVTTGLQAVIETDLANAIAASEASFTSVKDAAADTTIAASALARAAYSSSAAAASHQQAAQFWMQALPFIPMGGNQEYVDPLAPGASPFMASGGIVSSSFAMVGELGRELVSLPMGSRVFSASQTEDILSESFKPTVNMMAASVEMPSALQVETDSRASQSSGGDNIVVNFNGDMNIRDQRDIELLVDEIDRELGRRTQNAKRGMAGTTRSVSVD